VLVLALVVLAIVLAWPVPRMLAQVTTVRRGPRSALVLWQSTAVAAVLAALFAAPAAVASIVGSAQRLQDDWLVVAVAALVTGLVAVRLLVSGDRVGRNLRSVRRRHRELVDLLAMEGEGHTRVLEHPTATAYCLPGVRRRVVLTQGTIDRLSPDELEAVMAHERAHLVARHDLVMEFFTVVHEAVPRFVRSSTALHEVHLLIEVLADRAAVRRVGVVTTARAIVGMADAARPAGSMAIRESTADARARIELLDGGPVAGLPAPLAAALTYAVSALVVAAPVTLLALAYSGFSAG
jgi:Zn-dependent protease with chaperone function